MSFREDRAAAESTAEHEAFATFILWREVMSLTMLTMRERA